MKTAIAGSGTTIESRLDMHFGKCVSFFIFDDITGKTEVFENPAQTVKGCKGEIIVKELIRKNVKRVIAGDFGTQAQQLLNKHHIQMIIHPNGMMGISDLINLLTNKNQ